MRVTRRSFLVAGAAVAAGTAFTRAARAATFAAASEPQSLNIPPLLDSRTQGQAIELAVQAGRTEFFPGLESDTLGYSGSYLGPTIRVHRGDNVQIAIANSLQEATTVHWHGLIVPAELDGGPHQLIGPGATWRPVLPVRQPAATLFYHSHLHGETARQVYFGLAGVLVFFVYLKKTPAHLQINSKMLGSLGTFIAYNLVFGAAIPAVGVMDMLRFHKFTIGWAWTSDYGSSDDPAEFKALYSYSPLHNLKSGTKYPPTLIATSDHDDRVVPGHSFKFAATMQADQAGAEPVLIRIEVKAGHGAGKSITKLIDETADTWAFVAHNLDMKVNLQ